MLDENICHPMKVLAVASKGGHWDELMQVRPAFDAVASVHYATTDASLARAYALSSFIAIADYNQNEPLKVVRGIRETFHLVKRIRPDVVVSTGAAPGLLCILWGRVFGAHTIWIDSIANADEFPLSGKIAARFAHKVVTQWQHLSKPGKVEYWGSIL